MKTFINLFFLFYAFGSIKAQYPPNGDSTFFYRQDGSKEWYYYQRDVAFFRMNGGGAFTGTPPSGVTSITYMPDHPDGYNKMIFDTSATGFQTLAAYYYLNSFPDFDYGFLAVTKDKDQPADKKLWYMGGDEIIVTFRDSVTTVDVDSFEVRNNLKLKHAPSSSLPVGPNRWAYIFYLTKNDRFDPFDACATIWENENGYVTQCEPDLQLYRAADCAVSPEMTANAATSTPDALWHIRNNGAGILLNPITGSGYLSGTSGADANICECWGDGYHGEGIKVAVIDIDGFDYSHPDMSGQYLSGYDFINNTSFSSTYFPNTQSAGAHGQEVSSVIAAKANTGSNTKAVGVAYACQIKPYLTMGTTADLIAALQQAVIDNVDVVNISLANFNNGITFSSLYTTIQNGQAVGRGGKGIIYVSATGNNNASVRAWPALDAGVIGVGATTPDDYRASPNQWFWTGGSDYLNSATQALHYDVVAPGTEIMLATTTSPNTSPTSVNKMDNGTSYASPVVAGIAAILLSKFTNMTYQNVATVINGNADQVSPAGSFNANANLPGYNDQYFYGRVNCMNALANPATGIKETINLPKDIRFAYLNKDESAVLFSKGTNDKGSLLKIYDISSRVIETHVIEPNANTFILNTSKYSEGMYVINVNTNNNGQGSFKYIK